MIMPENSYVTGPLPMLNKESTYITSNLHNFLGGSKSTPSGEKSFIKILGPYLPDRPHVRVKTLIHMKVWTSKYKINILEIYQL